jgi:hypothetical protein
VSDLAVNGHAFTNTTGWYTEKGIDNSVPTLEIATDPPLTVETAASGAFTSYLYFPDNGTQLMNSSINSHRSGLGDIIEGKTRYALRIKYKTNLASDYEDAAPAVKIYRYARENDKFIVRPDGKEGDNDYWDGILFNFEKIESVTTNEEIQETDFIYMEATCEHSLS